MLAQMKPSRSEKPLQCPECDAQFWLTWRRYLSLIGWQTCPECGVRSRNDRPIWTHVYSLLGLLAGVLPYGLLLAVGASQHTARTAFEVVGILGMVVLDRHLDARIGKLVPFKSRRKD